MYRQFIKEKNDWCGLLKSRYDYHQTFENESNFDIK